MGGPGNGVETYGLRPQSTRRKRRRRNHSRPLHVPRAARESRHALYAMYVPQTGTQADHRRGCEDNPYTSWCTACRGLPRLSSLFSAWAHCSPTSQRLQCGPRRTVVLNVPVTRGVNFRNPSLRCIIYPEPWLCSSCRDMRTALWNSPPWYTGELSSHGSTSAHLIALWSRATNPSTDAPCG
ncbi:hypothetical protein BKA93DRAFT_184316 [Sparassis latifolia]